MFEELMDALYPRAGRKALVDGVAWIVLSHVVADLYTAVRSGSKYPAQVELVKIRREEFVPE